MSHIKSFAYETPLDREADLHARDIAVCDAVQQAPGMFSESCVIIMQVVATVYSYNENVIAEGSCYEQVP